MKRLAFSAILSVSLVGFGFGFGFASRAETLKLKDVNTCRKWGSSRKALMMPGHKLGRKNQSLKGDQLKSLKQRGKVLEKLGSGKELRVRGSDGLLYQCYTKQH